MASRDQTAVDCGGQSARRAGPSLRWLPWLGFVCATVVAACDEPARTNRNAHDARGSPDAGSDWLDGVDGRPNDDAGLDVIDGMRDARPSSSDDETPRILVDAGPLDAIPLDATPLDATPPDAGWRGLDCIDQDSPAAAPYRGMPIPWAAHCHSTAIQPLIDAPERIVLIGDDVLIDLGERDADHENHWRTGVRWRLARRLAARGIPVPDAADFFGRGWYEADMRDHAGFWGCAAWDAGLADVITSAPFYAVDGGLPRCIREAVHHEGSMVIVISFGRYRREIESTDRDRLLMPPEQYVARFTEAIRGLRMWYAHPEPERVAIYVTDFVDYTDGLAEWPDGCADDEDDLDAERTLVDQLNRWLMEAALDAADDLEARFDVISLNARFVDRTASCAQRDENVRACLDALACGSVHPLDDATFAGCCLSAPAACLGPDIDGREMIARTIAQALTGR